MVDKIHIGTKEGDHEEIAFTKNFNRNKTHTNFAFYLENLSIANASNCFMVRVTTNQPSTLSNQKVKTRADSYLIQSDDNTLLDILESQDYYLDESALKNIVHNKIPNSGVSIKRSGSKNYQILKTGVNSFYTLFNSYELGAGASIYCKRDNELHKNIDVLNGWNTDITKMRKFFKDDNITFENITTSKDLCKKIKARSNELIKELINKEDNIKLRQIIFNGMHIYKEPYTAHYFFQGNSISKLDTFDFIVTTGSGRSKGEFTIVLKPI